MTHVVFLLTLSIEWWICGKQLWKFFMISMKTFQENFFSIV